MDSLTQDEQISRYLRCVHNPFEFARYVKVKDATTNSIVPYLMWDHLKVLITHVSQKKHKRIVVLKPKQVGFSWTVGFLHLWMCHKTVANILVISKGEDYAAELLDKSRFINLHMPDWLRLRTGQDGALMMTFPDTSSRIKALPSTEDAGVGETASHVTRDELDFHDYAEENFGHISPTIDAGATILDGSTAKRSKPDSHFKELYRRAKRGENNYYPMFWHAFVRPDRGWEWYDETRKNYQPVWLFEQDYPVSEEDALGAIAGLGLFDKDAITKLLEDTRNPIDVQGAAYIYHLPDPKKRYYCGGDMAEGRSGDYSVLWIIDKDGLVAVLRSNQLVPSLFAFHAVSLLRQFGNPQIVCGADAWGQMFLSALRDLKYYNIYNSKPDKLGFIEDEKNKQTNLMNFAMTVKNGFKVPLKDAITEMYGWNVNKKGNYESTGAYDDCIQAAVKADFSMRTTANVGDKYPVISYA